MNSQLLEEHTIWQNILGIAANLEHEMIIIL